MTVRAVCYISQAVAGLARARVRQIGRGSTDFNRGVNVTGVLLLDVARFLQYFEGPHDGVEAVLERILAAEDPSDVEVLANGSVPRRYFPQWSMRIIPTSASALQHAATTDWSASAADSVQRLAALSPLHRGERGA